MTAAGFDCPEGTRLIIQRPDGYFTALIQGNVITRMVIEPGFTPEWGLGVPDKIIGASVFLDCKIDQDENGNLWKVALGKYED